MAAVINMGLNYFLRCDKLLIRNLSSYSSVSDIYKGKSVNKSYTVKGWVSSLRKMKEMVFLDIDDGSSTKTLQIIIPKAERPENLSHGSSIEAQGNLSTNNNGHLELHAKNIKVIGSSDPVRFPFSPKQKHTHDYCRQYLHLRPKLPHFKSLLRVRHSSMKAINDWFDSHNFVSIHTPILTSSDCEGAGEIFKILPVSQNLVNEMKKKNQSDDDAFFGNTAYLSVSGQLHLEAITRSLKKVYSMSPTFRAENSKSRLHLTEFYMLEAEEAFISNLDDILETMESLLKHIISHFISNCENDLRVITKYDSVDFFSHLSQLEGIVEKKFHRLSFEEACKIVGNNNDNFKTKFCEKDGFAKEHELFLVQHFEGTPLFVRDWPKSIKPFYMKATENNPQLVSSVDLLVPNVGELCGGSLREDNLVLLEQKLTECGIEDSMQWYLDLRRYGNVPTGGFGMGFERFLQLVTGLTNIKDTIPFPRWPHSLKM